MSMTQKDIVARCNEFDKILRKLEDEVYVLKERIDITRGKVSEVKTFEDAEAFDNWYANNFLDTGLNYITIDGV